MLPYISVAVSMIDILSGNDDVSESTDSSERLREDLFKKCSMSLLLH